jgi:hypothetical protein
VRRIAADNNVADGDGNNNAVGSHNAGWSQRGIGVEMMTQRLEGITRLVNGKAMSYEKCSCLVGVGQEMLINPLREICSFGRDKHR